MLAKDVNITAQVKNKITLFDVSFNDLHEDNKHYKYNIEKE